VATSDTKQLIAQAIERLQQEVPSLRQIKLVVRLELRARGSDAPIWRVEVPGPKIDRDAAADARLDVAIGRPYFNELAADGRLKNWVEAYDLGHVQVSGEPAVIKLLGSVIARQWQRTR
jgi:hypothetical protein